MGNIITLTGLIIGASSLLFIGWILFRAIHPADPRNMEAFKMLELLREQYPAARFRRGFDVKEAGRYRFWADGEIPARQSLEHYLKRKVSFERDTDNAMMLVVHMAQEVLT